MKLESGWLPTEVYVIFHQLLCRFKGDSSLVESLVFNMVEHKLLQQKEN